MIDNSIMDDLLVELKSRYPNQLNVGSYLMTTHNLTSKDYPIYRDKLIDEKIVNEPTALRNKLIMSNKGIELLDKYGSWTNYQKSLDKKLKTVEHKESLEIGKLQFDMKLIKSQLSTNRWTKWIALATLLVSLALLVIEVIKLTE